MTSSQIHSAAREGKLSDVKKLVAEGVPLGEGDVTEDGNTPLMSAIKYGHREVTEFLTGEMSSETLAAVTTSTKWNVLHWMAGYGRPWLNVWKEIERKCPQLRTQRDANDKRPIDKAREHRNRSRRHTELYQKLEGEIQDEYVKGISEKVEKKCNITITFVGHEGVGKTCLVEQLRNKNIPPEGPPSTDTANIFIKHMLFDPETSEKEVIEEGSELTVGNQRIRRVLTSFNVGSEKKIETDSATIVYDRQISVQKLPSTDANMQMLDMSLTPDQQKEIQDYRQFMTWRDECRTQTVDLWEENMKKENFSTKQNRLVRKFLTIFSQPLKRKNYCSCCTEFCGKPWYRCLECVDTNVCSTCYFNGIQPENEHDESHDTMVLTGHATDRYRCRGCEGMCLETYFQCKVCKEWYLCLGCYNSSRVKHTDQHDLVKMVRVKYAYRLPSDDQHAAAKDVIEIRTNSKNKGLVTIYDFGGEKIFYNTHHCILTDDMVFILVFDVSICQDQNEQRKKDGYDRIEFWLRSIATCAIDEDAKRKGTPPIVLIGSHMDLIPGSEEEKETVFTDIIKGLCFNPEIKFVIRKHVKAMFHVSNLNDSSINREIYDKIWRAVLEAAKYQSQWQREIPARWLALEQELIKRKKAGTKVMKYQDLKTLNNALVVPLKNAGDINAFLRYLKTTGYFLCFGIEEWDEGIQGDRRRRCENRFFIILDPQWIISAFKCIITSPKFKTNLSIKEKEEWKAYEESGELPVEFMTSLMGNETGHKFMENFRFICIVMETLGLISSPLLDSDEELEMYIVPCMLRHATPERIQPILDDPHTIQTPVLCIKFDKDFIPKAIWDKVIAKCIHRFKPLKMSLVQRGFVCLSMDSLWSFVLNCSKNAMKILLFTKRKPPIPPGKGVEFRKLLEFLIQRVLEMNHQGHFRYSYYLHNDFEFSKDEEMVKADDVMELSQPICVGGKGNSVLSPNDYCIWFKDRMQIRAMTTTDDALSVDVPNRKPSPKEIGRISRFIGKDYLSFFMQLEYPIASVEQYFQDYQGFSFRVIITRILIAFFNFKPDAGFPQIASAMKGTGLDIQLLETVLDTNRKPQFLETNFPNDDLQQSLSVEDVLHISKYISPKLSFILFLELDLDVLSIEREEVQVRNISEQISTLMKFWINREGRLATVNKLLLAMKECDMDRDGLVKALKENSNCI